MDKNHHTPTGNEVWMKICRLLRRTRKEYRKEYTPTMNSLHGFVIQDPKWSVKLIAVLVHIEYLKWTNRKQFIPIYSETQIPHMQIFFLKLPWNKF